MVKNFKFGINCFLYYAIANIVMSLIGLDSYFEHVELLFMFAACAKMLLGVKKIKNKFEGYTQFDVFIFVIFMITCIISIIRSINIVFHKTAGIPRFIGGVYYAPAWLVPLFMIYGKSINIWKAIVDFNKKFLPIFIIISPFLFITSNYYYVLILFIPVYLFNYDKLTSRQKVVTMVAYLIANVFFLLHGIRHMTARMIYYPVVYYLILLFNRNKIKKRFYLVASMSFAFVIAGFVLYSVYNGQILDYIKSDTLRDKVDEYSSKNLNTDSRTIVYADFIADFVANGGYIFGRGVLGTTYSYDFIAVQESMDDAYNNVFGFQIGVRTEVECGYLMYILKVGFWGLLLMIILALRAIYLGLFHSNNFFIKLVALIIVEWLISMVPYGMPEFSIGYILFWVSLGACLNRNMRNMGNNEIYGHLFGLAK